MHSTNNVCISLSTFSFIMFYEQPSASSRQQTNHNEICIFDLALVEMI